MYRSQGEGRSLHFLGCVNSQPDAEINIGEPWTVTLSDGRIAMFIRTLSGIARRSLPMVVHLGEDGTLPGTACGRELPVFVGSASGRLGFTIVRPNGPIRSPTVRWPTCGSFESGCT